MIQSYAAAPQAEVTNVRPLAYRVPWRVEREKAPTFRIVNDSSDAVHGVTLSISGAAVMLASPPRLVAPGEAVSVTIVGHDIARDTLLVIRWFRDEGDEYLWRVSF
jgi:hypothetical protein